MQSQKRCLLLPFLITFFLMSNPAQAVLRPFLTTETAVPLDRGQTKLETGFRYERISNSDRTYTLNAELTTGIINNLEFLVDVPFIFDRTKKNNTEGLGDLRLKAKLRFLKGREATPISIAGQLIIKFPSGDKDLNLIRSINPSGSGEADVGFQIIASEEFSLFTMHLNLGYTFVGNPPGEDFRNVLNYSLAIEYEAIPKSFKIVGELTGHRQIDTNISGDPLELLAGISQKVSNQLMIDAGVAVGLTSASPDYTINVGVTYNF